MSIMLKKISLVAFFGALLLISHASKACTFKQAQEKMLEVTNLQQVYNREMLAYMQKGEEYPDEPKRLALAEAAAEVGILLSSQSANITDFNTKVDSAICQQYDDLKQKYAAGVHQNAPVAAQPQATSADCTTNQLWKRYGDASQKQVALSQAGKLSKSETNDLMEMGTWIGQYSTTDLAKACDMMSQYEARLK